MLRPNVVENCLILLLLLLNGHQQLCLQLPKEVLVTFDLEAELAVSRLHILHLIVDNLAHVLKRLVLVSDALGDDLVDRGQFSLELGELGVDRVAHVSNFYDVSPQLVLLLVKVLVEPFDVSERCLDLLVRLVHPVEVPPAVLLDLLRCGRHPLTISATEGHLLLQVGHVRLELLRESIEPILELLIPFENL